MIVKMMATKCILPLFALNEDCLTQLLKFLKLQDLICLDLCASGDLAQCVGEGSSYLTSLQHLNRDDLVDAVKGNTDSDAWSPQSILWAGRKNLQCLLSLTRLVLAGEEEEDCVEEEGKERDEEERRVLVHRRIACMEKALRVVGTKCTELGMIRLKGYMITDRGISAMLEARGAPITELDLRFCESITDASLNAISQHLRLSLDNLTILGCSVSDAGLVNVFSQCTKLCALHLDLDSHDEWLITPATLFAIAKNLPGLKYLFCNCEGFILGDVTPNEAFVAIAKAAKKLSQLFIAYVEVDDAFLVALVDNCPNLTKFSFDDTLDEPQLVTDVGVVALAKSCPKLTDLSLKSASKTTVASIVALGKHCRKLRELKVPTSITDAGLEILLQSCKSLRRLYMEDCDALTAASITTLANHGSKLRALSFHNARWLDDASLLTIASACPNLTALKLDYFFEEGEPARLSNDGMLAVARVCKKLRHLDLTDVELGVLLTDEGQEELHRISPLLVVEWAV